MSEYIKDEICQTEDMRKIFVGNINLEATNDDLHAFIEQQVGAGTIADCAIIPPKADKKPKYKMGFVTFYDSNTPDELFLVRDNLTFKGVKLDVKRAVPKSDTSPGAHEKSKKLFIANLPNQEFPEEELKKYFTDRHPTKYGEIERIQLIKKKAPDGTRLSENQGFGFLMVTSEDFADKLAIQHRNFMFRNRKIELKKSVPNDGGFGGGFSGGRGRGGQRGGPRGGRGGAGGYGNQGGYGGGYGGGYDEGYGYGAPSWDQGGYGGEWDQGGYGGGYEAGYGADGAMDNAYGGGQSGYGGGYSQGGYGGGSGGRGAGRGAGGRGAGRGAARGAAAGGRGAGRGAGGGRGAGRGGGRGRGGY